MKATNELIKFLELEPIVIRIENGKMYSIKTPDLLEYIDKHLICDHIDCEYEGYVDIMDVFSFAFEDEHKLERISDESLFNDWDVYQIKEQKIIVFIKK